MPGADVVFEVTGNAAAVRATTDVVRVWGTISMVAIHGSRLYSRADGGPVMKVLIDLGA